MKNSKNFKESEIKAVLPDGSLYLKEGVRRMYKYKHLEENMDDLINKEMRFRERYYKLMRKMYGEDWFELGVS